MLRIVDSSSVVVSVDDRFPFAVSGLFLSSKHTTALIKVEKQQILLVLFTPHPLLRYLIYNGYKPINCIFLHAWEIR